MYILYVSVRVRLGYFCARRVYKTSRKRPKPRQSTLNVFCSLWAAVVWLVVRNFPHNPKVGGSNPPPATKRNHPFNLGGLARRKQTGNDAAARTRRSAINYSLSTAFQAAGLCQLLGVLPIVLVRALKREHRQFFALPEVLAQPFQRFLLGLGDLGNRLPICCQSTEVCRPLRMTVYIA
jgi:hypothetical protein